METDILESLNSTLVHVSHNVHNVECSRIKIYIIKSNIFDWHFLIVISLIIATAICMQKRVRSNWERIDKNRYRWDELSEVISGKNISFRLVEYLSSLAYALAMSKQQFMITKDRVLTITDGCAAYY